MKRVMVLLVLGCLLLGMAAVAAGAETTIYLDVVGNGIYHVIDNFTFYDQNGAVDSNLNNECNGNLSGFIIGTESSFDKFKAGIEYGKVNTDGYHPTQNDLPADFMTIKHSFTLAEVKAGYWVIDQEKWKLGPSVSVLDINSDDDWINNDTNQTVKLNSNIGGNMLGVDFTVDFSKITIQGTLATSLLGSNFRDLFSLYTEGGTCVESSLNEIKLKVNYVFNEHFGLALGYRSYQFSAKYETRAYVGAPLQTKMDAGGNINIITLGAVYQF